MSKYIKLEDAKERTNQLYHGDEPVERAVAKRIMDAMREDADEIREGSETK